MLARIKEVHRQYHHTYDLYFFGVCLATEAMEVEQATVDTILEEVGDYLYCLLSCCTKLGYDELCNPEIRHNAKIEILYNQPLHVLTAMFLSHVQKRRPNREVDLPDIVLAIYYKLSSMVRYHSLKSLVMATCSKVEKRIKEQGF